jgi:hypothetical protein
MTVGFRTSALLSLGGDLLLDALAICKRPQALSAMLYRAKDRLCRGGTFVMNLALGVSFEQWENFAPSNCGIKHLKRSAWPRTAMPRRSGEISVS